MVQAQAARRGSAYCPGSRPGGGAGAGAAAAAGTPRRGRRRRGWRLDGQHGLGALPQAAPGFRHLPRRGQWFAGGRALHPRERQGGHRHGRLRRNGPRTDTERVRAPGGHRQGPLRVRRQAARAVVVAARPAEPAPSAPACRRTPDQCTRSFRRVRRRRYRRRRSDGEHDRAPSTPGSRSTGPSCRRAPTAAAREAGPCTTSAARRPRSDALLSSAAAQ